MLSEAPLVRRYHSRYCGAGVNPDMHPVFDLPFLACGDTIPSEIKVFFFLILSRAAKLSWPSTCWDGKLDYPASSALRNARCCQILCRHSCLMGQRYQVGRYRTQFRHSAGHSPSSCFPSSTIGNGSSFDDVRLACRALEVTREILVFLNPSGPLSCKTFCSSSLTFGSLV